MKHQREGLGKRKPNSENKEWGQIRSGAVSANALYPNSVDNQANVFCLRDVQEIIIERKIIVIP